MTEATNVNEKLRYGWLITTTLIGAVVVGAAIAGDVWFGWRDVWVSLGLEVGAAVALVSIIFALERRFVSKVVARETSALEVRFSQRASELEESLRSQAIRLDQIADATRSATEERYAKQDAVLQALNEQFSLGSVIAALSEAERLNALGPSFQVRASPDPRGLRLRISQVTVEAGWNSGPTDRHAVFISLWSLDEGDLRGTDSIDGRHIRTTAAMVWEEDMAPGLVGDRIIEKLQKAGRYTGPSSFDPALAFQNLRDSVSFAIESRRGENPETPRLQGRLVEKFNTEWYVSDLGIERPSSGFLLPSSELRSNPTVPGEEGIDEHGWRDLLDLGKEVLKPSPFPRSVNPGS